MADNADIGNDLMQERLDRILAARPTALVGVSAWWCDDCGGDIAEARRLAVPGCHRCAECQGLAERRAR